MSDSQKIPNPEHSLTEKERYRAAVRQLHHQAGNTFQNLCSLIGILQREKTVLSQDDSKKLIGHIQTFSDLHEILADQLAESPSAQPQISINRTLECMARRITMKRGTQVKWGHIDPLTVTPRTATSFGIICNELMDNAAKYGAGEMVLNLVDQGDRALFSISNNLKNQIDCKDLQKRSKGGLGLVHTLVQAYFDTPPAYESDGHSKFKITFALPMSKARIEC